jgi:hypothetical protein
MPETENSTIAKINKNSHKDLLTIEGLCSRLREGHDCSSSYRLWPGCL